MARIVVFVRGTQPNREGWVANPTANPGARRGRSGLRAPRAARRGSLGKAPRLCCPLTEAPSRTPRTADLSVLDRRGWGSRAGLPTDLSADLSAEARSAKVEARSAKAAGATRDQGLGRQQQHEMSPDGSKLAFVSNRVDHSLIGVYERPHQGGEVPVAERRSRQQSHVVA